MAISYNKQVWKPTDEFDETTANKWENGIDDACNGVNEVNSNLDDLAYGENAGGANLWNEDWETGAYNASTGNKTTDASRIRCVNPIPIESGKDIYVASSDNVTLMFLDSSGNLISLGSQNYVSLKNDTYKTPSSAKSIIFHTANTYGGTYKNDICISYGTSGSYNPYIMSNKQITEQNASLEEQGLLNKFDGNLKNGWIENGVVKPSEQDVHCVNAIPCSSGDVISLHFEKAPAFSKVVFYNGSSYVSESDYVTSNGNVTVPNNVNNFKLYVHNSGITPQNVGRIGVYVNNAIDEIKNDLAIKDISNQLSIVNTSAIKSLEHGAVYRSGNMCEVIIRFTATEDIPKYNRIIQVPKPHDSSIYIIGTAADNAYEFPLYDGNKISTSGTGIPSGSNVRIHVTYMVD